MSNKTRNIARKVKEQKNRMYMDNMYDLFNLSLFQLLSLRHSYLRHMKKREREQKRFARDIRRRYKIAKV